MSVFSDQACQLGEGALWLNERQRLLWFDILNKQVYLQGDNTHTWQFDEYVSAAAEISADEILLASENHLSVFNLRTGTREVIAKLEAENTSTRSNDGRADNFGGFWISTMDKHAKKEAGAIYRYYQGELRQLFASISIPNAICFSPDGSLAYFADTKVQKLWSVRLDNQGWPAGDPQLFIDFSIHNQNPDGAITDQSGNLWIALWGASRITCYSPQGKWIQDIEVPALQPTCPAFGGHNMRTLFVTSAFDGLAETKKRAEDGQTFAYEEIAMGQQPTKVVR